MKDKAVEINDAFELQKVVNQLNDLRRCTFCGESFVADDCAAELMATETYTILPRRAPGVKFVRIRGHLNCFRDEVFH